MVGVFNWFDVVVIIFLLSYSALVLRRGFLVNLFEFVGFAFSVALTMTSFPLLASVLGIIRLPATAANTLSFIVLWVLYETLAIIVLRHFFRELPMKMILSRFNRYLGIGPAIATALIIIIFISSLLIVLPTNSAVKSSVTQSQTLGRILPFTTRLNEPLTVAFSQSVAESITLLSTRELGEKEFVKLHFPKLSLIPDVESEGQTVEMLNKTRLRQGLPALIADRQLAKVAQDHSYDMFERGYFGHTDPDKKDPRARMIAAGIYFTIVAENLSYAPDALTAHISFLRSPAHLKNIVDPKFKRVGVGVADAGRYGKMFTQLFTD
ncbi:MAG: hypothetical protein A2126_00420 [Candidatus Woykebacteria bacterium GWB1_45_5]|uniref:SCP domain-containing protein n=1 Tax=Candidatus Woykebacteria bacterium GWB1_45_5 TaxID=1802592 RepID=A0A1G1W4P5_9BACT|nr:MAG: hypothetical protein A2126_00420 [Candidatus Woykebacteria bacterium GWB1_45_5]